MKNKIEPVLYAEEIAEIFRVQVDTVYRWVQDAVQGKNNFPLPIDMPGRRYCWHRDKIMEFMLGTMPIVKTAKRVGTVRTG